MRSILYFLLIAFMTQLIPGMMLIITSSFGGGNIALIVSQIFVMFVAVIIFSKFLANKRNYEVETQKLLDPLRDVEKLKNLREERRTYRSKATITGKILTIEYSLKELLNLRKYASTPVDMEHYYSALIDNLPKEDRKKIKEARDKYLGKYGKKSIIFPDFKENFRTSTKWMTFFFACALIYRFAPSLFMKNKIALEYFMWMGMVLLAIVMLNTILWITRTLRSYWDRDFVEIV